MGVRLTVRMRGEAGADQNADELRLDDDVITLGRDPKCQVVLAQQAVSRNHARIWREGSLFFVEDLNSAYGTILNGTKMSKGEKKVLSFGDTIAIAQFDVTFDKPSDFENIRESQDGKTAFVSRNLVQDALKKLSDGTDLPFFRVMTGPNEGQKFEIEEGREYIIGRDDGADITLPDDLISRKHAKVRRDWSGTHVEDLRSRNGIRINKKKKPGATLKDRDEVMIGSVKLLFIDPNDVREAAPVQLKSNEAESTVSVHSEVAEPPSEEHEEPLNLDKSGELPKDSIPDGNDSPDAADEGEPPPEDEQPAEDQGDSESSDDENGGEGAEEESSGFDLSKKENIAIVAVVGVLGFAALILLVMLFAGA